ncbi:MAG: hypothetical protein BGO09_04155 [Bacteroidetes bacterium 47-18]|nr:MAG: hypothetical protein BGO09_04155 [Bacteroidetes bacterium 47-18]
MKKILLSLFLVFTTLAAFTQASDHLTFKGVPIDGTLDEYVAEMKKNGFSYLGTDGGIALLNGDFAGYKDCYLGVSTLKQKDLVHNIVVVFSDKDTWSTLSGNYFNLKDMLIEKYGKPSSASETFDVPSFKLPLDDNDKMYEVKFDNCKYYSIWETDKGAIQLSIEHNGISSCFVQLAYFDKINGEKIKASAIDDL